MPNLRDFIAERRGHSIHCINESHLPLFDVSQSLGYHCVDVVDALLDPIDLGSDLHISIVDLSL